MPRRTLFNRPIVPQAFLEAVKRLSTKKPMPAMTAEDLVNKKKVRRPWIPVATAAWSAARVQAKVQALWLHLDAHLRERGAAAMGASRLKQWVNDRLKDGGATRHRAR